MARPARQRPWLKDFMRKPVAPPRRQRLYKQRTCPQRTVGRVRLAGRRIWCTCMSFVVCCPCGNPLECDSVELVVSLTCPHCSQELTLEFEDIHGRRCRAVITVMDGPHWVGERFVAPVGKRLSVGSAIGNWLSLDSDSLSNRHCNLCLTGRGNLILEDSGSRSGTWVGKLRVKRAKLEDTQSFRVGGFRLRLDYELSDGSSMGTAVSPMEESTFHLPQLVAVDKALNSPANWAARNRFRLARWLLTAFAWSAAVYHFSRLSRDGGWEWYSAGAVGLVIVLAFAELGRRVALVRPSINYVSLVMASMLVVLDCNWQLPLAAVSAFILIVSLVLLAVRPPSPAQAVAGLMIGMTSCLLVAAAAIPAVVTSVLDLVGSFRFE